VGRGELFIWCLLIAMWMKHGSIRFDKQGKKTAFASGLCPGWDNGKNSTNNHTHVEISAGGLSDSNADAVNPFLQPVQPDLVTKKKGTSKFMRNYLRQNEVSRICLLKRKSDRCTLYRWLRLSSLLVRLPHLPLIPKQKGQW
jgi:hypothetical protein